MFHCTPSPLLGQTYQTLPLHCCFRYSRPLKTVHAAAAAAAAAPPFGGTKVVSKSVGTAVATVSSAATAVASAAAAASCRRVPRPLHSAETGPGSRADDNAGLPSVSQPSPAAQRSCRRHRQSVHRTWCRVAYKKLNGNDPFRSRGKEVTPDIKQIQKCPPCIAQYKFPPCITFPWLERHNRSLQIIQSSVFVYGVFNVLTK